MNVCYPDGYERLVTNELNRLHRNCCIGNVRWKYANPFIGVKLTVDGAHTIKMTEELAAAVKRAVVRKQSAI